MLAGYSGEPTRRTTAAFSASVRPYNSRRQVYRQPHSDTSLQNDLTRNSQSPHKPYKTRIHPS